MRRFILYSKVFTTFLYAIKTTIIFLTLTGILFSQTKDKKESRSELKIQADSPIKTPDHNNMYAEKNFALLFSFSGLGRAGAGLQDGGIGGKYYFSDKLAIKGVLQYNSLTMELPYETEPYTIENSWFALNSMAEFHIRRQRVSPYFGFGLKLGFYPSESKKIYKKRDDAVYKVKTEGSGSLDIFGILGSEIYITKRISLSFEYRLFYRYFTQGRIKTTYSTVRGSSTVTTKSSYKGMSSNSFGFQNSGFLTLGIYL